MPLDLVARVARARDRERERQNKISQLFLFQGFNKKEARPPGPAAVLMDEKLLKMLFCCQTL